MGGQGFAADVLEILAGIGIVKSEYCTPQTIQEDYDRSSRSNYAGLLKTRLVAHTID